MTNKKRTGPTMAQTMMGHMKTAMLNKEDLRKGVLSLLRAALIAAEKEKGSELEPEEEITIVSRELKQTKDSLNQFEKAGRMDLVAKEHEKIAIIETYLPQQMKPDEIKQLIESLNIDKTGSVGQAIKQVMPLVKGKADGKTVKELIEVYMKS